MRIFDSIRDAQAALLRRRPLENALLPEPVARRLAEVFGEPLSADLAVDRIIAAVRLEGDAAVRRFSVAFDGSAPAVFAVDRAAVAAAYDAVPATLISAMRLAAEQIADFHRRQLPKSWTHFSSDGALGQLVIPLERVGLYAPGGRAAYPSTVLMSAVPARVAGVGEILVASPPAPDGSIPASVLVAADIAGVDRVFAVGGAQAIAALAFGTASIPHVDKILGPGNLFVTLAKKKVFGEVAIDQLAGPTETLIIADSSSDPRAVALDLLAQAEHDPLASPILITTDRAFAEAVGAAIESLLGGLSRADIARQALDANGGAVVVPDLATAIDLANAYAPEHLCLVVAAPWTLLGRIRNAGGVFVGGACPEALGDYVAGPSHVMPTGGTARFASPLNVLDFVKITSLFALGPAEVARLAPAAVALAKAEGFTAHAAAIEARLGRTQGSSDGGH